MPPTRIDEALREVKREELEAEIGKKELQLEAERRKYRIYALKAFGFEMIYYFSITLMLGFALYAWFPAHYSNARALGIGLVFYVAFEELKIHLMFKK